jgi:hypothetical protein
MVRRQAGADNRTYRGSLARPAQRGDDLPLRTSAAGFGDIGDVGMWVSRTEVAPLRVDAPRDLAAELKAQNVELRVVKSLVPLRNVWQTSLPASGIRLRNAEGWA